MGCNVQQPLAGRSRQAYLRVMRAFVSRLLVLLAVLVAPLNMVSHAQAMTPAVATDAQNAATGHHGSAPDASSSEAAMAPDHCAGGSDERPGDRTALAFDCAIACAALPAMPAPIA